MSVKVPTYQKIASKLRHNNKAQVSSFKNFVIFAVLFLLISVPFLSMTGTEPNSMFEPFDEQKHPGEVVDHDLSTEASETSEMLGTRAGGDNENIVLFLHNVTDTEPSKSIPGSGSTWNWFDTAADFNTANTTLTATGTNNDFDWYLWPALASNLSTDQITLKMWAKAGGGSSQNAGITINIYERDSTGTETSIDNNNFGSVQFPATGTLFTWTVGLGGTHDFDTGSSIKVRLSANPGSGKIVYFYYDSPAANSRVVIPTTDHMEVSQIVTLDYNMNPTLNYQPTDANKTMYIRTTVADPLGGYDINIVNITMTDPDDNAILNNLTMYKISGTPISFLSEYNFTWNYSGYAPGRYNITILVIDNNGVNNYYHFALYTFGIFPDVEKSFFYIGALPKFLWVRALDDQSKPLENTIVYAKFAGNPVNFNMTNASGMANITLYPGQYDIVVRWQGVDVSAYTYNLTDNVTELDPIVVICAVYYPTLQAIDSAAVIVANAAIYITHPNRTQLLPFQTDTDGNVILNRMAGGNFDLIVRYRGVEVNISIIIVDHSGVYTIRCTIYYITFQAVDHGAFMLENIGVTVFDNATAWVLDFRITNTTGIAVTRVPMGTVDVQAYWQNIPVNTTYGVSITGDGFITVICSIFDINIKVVDSRSIVVEDAQVLVTKSQNGDLLDSGITSALGEVRLHLITGSYYFEVYWRSVLVSADFIQITDSSQKTIQAAIYYINFNTVDSKNNVVSDAQLSIYSSTTGTLIASERTNDTGLNEFRLPQGDIDIEVYWKTILVNSTSGVPITSDVDPFPVNLWIYYLTLSVLDSNSVPVANAQVTTYINGTQDVLASGITDKSGLLTLRLPSARVDFSIVWDNIVIYKENSYDLTDNSFEQIIAWVYYATINAVDSKGLPVSNAQIRVMDGQGGEILYTESTVNTGLAVFRLPLGSYYLEVFWHSVLVKTESDLAVSGNIDLHTLSVWIYYINFKVLDSHNTVVSNAQVLFTSPGSGEVYDSQMTTSNGMIESRLPVGTVNISVFWKDVEVLSEQYTVTSDVAINDPVELSCMIYYLTLTAVDSKQLQISDAQVVITTSSDDIVDSLTTGDTGLVVSRLPVGSYSITVRWLDVEIYNEDNVKLAADAQKTLNCKVFYITFNTKDAENLALEYSRIILTHIETDKVIFTNLTNEFGSIEARVPIGAFTLDVLWQDIQVSTTSYYFMEDDELSVICDVFYVTVILEDSKQVRLNDAQIIINLPSGDKIMASKTTGTNGEREFRIPSHIYDIEVYWQGVLVRSELSYAILSTHTVTLKCDVFYFSVVALDFERRLLDNARVELNINETGKLYDSIITDSSGLIESRIPIGYYNVSIYWKDVLVYSQLEYFINVTEKINLFTNVFYLKVRAVDKNGEAIPDVTVSISASETDLKESLYTNKKGYAEFRLPIENYDITGRLQTSHYLKEIDNNVSSTIKLRSGSETVKLKFSEYPPSFISTPAFYGVALPIIILIIIIFLIWFFIIRKAQLARKFEEEKELGEGSKMIPLAGPGGKIRVKQPLPSDNGEKPMESADDMTKEEPEDNPEDKPEGEPDDKPNMESVDEIRNNDH